MLPAPLNTPPTPIPLNALPALPTAPLNALPALPAAPLRVLVAIPAAPLNELPAPLNTPPTPILLNSPLVAALEVSVNTPVDTFNPSQSISIGALNPASPLLYKNICSGPFPHVYLISRFF